MHGRVDVAAGLLALVAGLAGCQLEPPFRAPRPAVPAAFRGAPGGEATALATPQQWWPSFGDPTLQSLLATAVRSNPDLRVAADRVMVARNGITVARSGLYPTVGFSGLPTDPVTQQLRTANSGRLDVDANIFELSLNASYEIDLWGRVRSQIDAADADFRAEAADAASARIGLLSTVAGAYFEVREADESIALLQRQADLDDARLQLASLRQQAGRAGANSAVEEARAGRRAREAALAQLGRQRSLAEIALALLVGDLPERFHLAPAPLRPAVSAPAPPAGLPSSLLQRRPDLVAAEARLRSSHAQINVAHSDLMPQVALTAKAGFVTGAVHHLLESGSTVFGLGPDVSLPIFNAGRLRAQLDSSRWQEDQALAEYRKTLLAAFGDVDRALLGYQAAVEDGERTTREAGAVHEQRVRAEARLAGGRGTRFELLDAQQRDLELQSRALHDYRARLDALVALYQALGGGWSAADVVASPESAGNQAALDP